MDTLTRGATDDLEALVDHSTLGIVQNESLDLSLERIGKHVDYPLRLYATQPADEWLNIAPYRIEAGDGAFKTSLPLNGVIQSFAGGRIGFQSKTVVGNIFHEGGQPLTFPATTLDYYRRLVLSSAADGSVVCKWSDPQQLVTNLTSPGALFSSLEGIFCGYVDLKCTSADGKFKAAGSSGLVIGNSSITRFGTGSANALSDFEIVYVDSSGGIKIRGGLLDVYSGSTVKELATYSGSGSGNASFRGDLYFLLSSIMPSPSNNTTYFVYIDMDTLPSVISVTETGRRLYPVTSGNIVLSALDPESTLRSRYVFLGLIRRGVGVWDTAVRESAARRRHYS